MPFSFFQQPHVAVYFTDKGQMKEQTPIECLSLTLKSFFAFEAQDLNHITFLLPQAFLEIPLANSVI